MLDQLQTLDTRPLLLANGHHTPFWDGALWWASQTFTRLPFYAALLAVLAGSFGRRAWVLVPLIAGLPLAYGVSRLYAWGAMRWVTLSAASYPPAV